MPNRFFSQKEFNDQFGSEMASAAAVYERRRADGMKDYSLATYDFVFISDEAGKLQSLGAFLKQNYGYKINEIDEYDGYYELTGDATEFPVDENNLMYWALDLYCKGYEFDCKLDGYGASGDPNNQAFPDLSSNLYDTYFDKAMRAYDQQNLGMAAIHLSTAIKIDATDPNAWYSRGIVKDELYTWKSARRDYDKAIELAPDFVEAIINRAANKDEAGEYSEAIDDYTTAIGFEPANAMAHFNRGNSKFNIGDKTGACEDWKKAEILGADYARKRIDKDCLTT